MAAGLTAPELRELSVDDYTARVAAFTDRAVDDRLRAACGMAQEKAQTLAEVWPLIGYLFEEPEVDEKAWRKVMKEGSADLLQSSHAALAELDGFEVSEVEEALEQVVADSGAKPGAVYQPVRVAVTGGSVSPGIFETVSALGQEQTLMRIEAAIDRCRAEQGAAG